jgi:lipopolysaccharide transport system ATP-binding protein
MSVMILCSLRECIFTISGECIFDVSDDQFFVKGIVEGTCEIPGDFLNNGSYYISIIFVENSSKQLYYYEECLSFEVEDFRENMNWYGQWMGMYVLNFLLS